MKVYTRKQRLNKVYGTAKYKQHAIESRLMQFLQDEIRKELDAQILDEIFQAMKDNVDWAK